MADLVVTPSDVIAQEGAHIERGTAGETITAGQVIVLAGTGVLVKADSNAVGLKSPRGIALNGAFLNQPLAIIRSGDLAMGAIFTAGNVYYSSETPGGIQPSTDVASEDVVLLGIARSTTVLAINIQVPGVTV